jgi:hypothetical protein
VGFVGPPSGRLVAVVVEEVAGALEVRALQRKAGREVDDVSDVLGDRVRGDGDVVAAARVADQDVAGTHDRHDRVAPLRERGLLVPALAVPRQVHGDCLVAEPL